MNDVIISSAARTPVGAFGKSLRNASASALGHTVIKEVLKRAEIVGSDVDEVVLGCALQAGLGQNITRQSAISAAIPVEVPAMTVNQVCGSGLRAILVGTQLIRAGDASVVVVGGTESMSQAPYTMKNARFGPSMNAVKAEDEILLNLTDKFYGCHMGITAENLAEQYSISREEQDQFTYWSIAKAKAAQDAGRFENEMCAVKVTNNSIDCMVSEDDCIGIDTSMEQIRKMPALYKTGGTVTAANSSGINDGAAALVLMSKEYALENGSPVLCEIGGYGQGGVDPSLMGYGPVPAIRNALHNSKMKLDEIDLVELNEAFAAQSLAVIKGLEEEGLGKLSDNKLNVNGGALALGAPMGAGGARILVTLIFEMLKQGARSGLASMCMGGGLGTSIIVKRRN